MAEQDDTPIFPDFLSAEYKEKTKKNFQYFVRYFKDWNSTDQSIQESAKKGMAYYYEVLRQQDLNEIATFTEPMSKMMVRMALHTFVNVIAELQKQEKQTHTN